jgi:lipoprotein-anchoring transpeptidase ErfK/SrfK
MARRKLVLPLLAALALVPAAPAAAADPERVPAGVQAAGVDLSGLTLPEAEARLTQELGGRFARPMVLGIAGRVLRLQPAQADFAFDALTTAKRALRNGGPGTVPLKLTFSQRAVRAWVDGATRKLVRAPRNATVTIGLRRVTLRRSRVGRGVAVRTIADAIGRQLLDEGAPRYVRSKLTKIQPATTTAEARRQFRTVITVDKRNFKLRLFKDFRVRKTYGVATGQPAYPTPSGRFAIQSKQVNPVWSVPNSPWAGELAGSRVAGGSPNNPLKARWMGVNGSIGIHGTGQEYSIGSRASHGCIRMRVRDVIDLFRRVQVGTPVLIR